MAWMCPSLTEICDSVVNSYRVLYCLLWDKEAYQAIIVVPVLLLHYYIHLMAFFPGQPGEAGTRKVNHSGFYWSKRWWGGSGISATVSYGLGCPCSAQTSSQKSGDNNSMVELIILSTPLFHSSHNERHRRSERNNCCSSTGAAATSWLRGKARSAAECLRLYPRWGIRVSVLFFFITLENG